nr:M15 family metallopeptidase [Actinotalea ferrariae]
MRVTSGGSAAVPGTSNHGKAQAVDFADVGASGGSRWRWLMDNAPRFGWVNPLWARDGNPWNGSQEPWHWEGVAVPVSSYRSWLTGAGITVPDLDTPDPIAPVPQEDDMPASVAVRHPNGSIALAGDDGTFVPLSSVDELEALKATGAVRLHDGPAGTLALPDGLIWNLRAAVGFRKSIQGEQDPGKVAAAVAATLVPAVLDALPPSAGLTVEQVTAAAETAVRNVLRSV